MWMFGIHKQPSSWLTHIKWKATWQDPSSFHVRSGADPVPQLSIPKSHQERAGLPGVLTHLWAQVRPPLLLKFLAQEGPTQSHQDTGTKEQPGTGSFWFLSAPWIWTCSTQKYPKKPCFFYTQSESCFAEFCAAHISRLTKHWILGKVLKKNKKEIIKSAAEQEGKSLNGFINEAIDEKINK